MKFTYILFDMSEGLLTVKLPNVVIYLYLSQKTNTCSKSSLEAVGKNVEYIQI